LILNHASLEMDHTIIIDRFQMFYTPLLWSVKHLEMVINSTIYFSSQPGLEPQVHVVPSSHY